MVPTLLVIVLAAGVCVLLAELRRRQATGPDLVRELLDREEAQRERLARVLHQDVCQRLSSVRVAANELAAQSRADPGGDGPLANVLEGLTRSQEAAEGIVRQLRPVGPEPTGLKTAIETLAAELSAAGPVRCFPDIEPVEEGLSTLEKTRVFRLVAEGLHNIIDGARASLVMVQVRRDGRHLRIQFDDDRLGLDAGASEARLLRAIGLTAFRRQVRVWGGSLQVSLAASGGARVWVRLPVGESDGG